MQTAAVVALEGKVEAQGAPAWMAVVVVVARVEVASWGEGVARWGALATERKTQEERQVVVEVVMSEVRTGSKVVPAANQEVPEELEWKVGSVVTVEEALAVDAAAGKTAAVVVEVAAAQVAAVMEDMVEWTMKALRAGKG